MTAGSYEAVRIGSLCSGYGGLELGLITALGTGSVAWHVEYDKHPAAVLEARFPDVPNYGDVTATDWTQVEPVDWLTAGYPCQPFSTAGKRKGRDDGRHLWPMVAAAIGVLRPGRVLLENVRGHVSLGLDAVLADLASLGYDATWGLVRAADVGAPHGRARLFVIAADAQRCGRDGRPQASQRRQVGRTTAARRGADVAANTAGVRPADESPRGNGGLQALGAVAGAGDGDSPRRHAAGTGELGRSAGIVAPAWGDYEPAVRYWEAVTGRPAPRPTEPAGRRAGERLSPRFVEWMMGLPAGWVTDVLPRNPALKVLGNGVVPQQAALAVSVLLHNAAVAA